MNELTNRPKPFIRPDKIAWRPHEDDLILNKWGLGMDKLKELTGRSTSEIFGRRVHLLKKKGVTKI